MVVQLSLFGRLYKNHAKCVHQSFFYDADHERRRKEQLKRLYNRTPEQIEEEEMLRTELKKIEARKKEREKRDQVEAAFHELMDRREN